MRLIQLFRWSILLLSIGTFGQNINPGADKVFRPEEVAEIRLTLSIVDKAFLLHPDNAQSEVYKEAVFSMKNTQINQTLEIPVGVRLRGNTSRNQDKKGFKIDFREFGGGKFHDYKKFNLKPDVNDPSLIRELLTLKLYQDMNVPAARTHPVKLYMNDEYMGIYLNVEQIDDEFLNMRFGHEEGFLYKCAYGASLEDNGQIYNKTIFESEINEENDTRAELNNFVEVLNGTYHPSQAAAQYESVFEVDNYLRQLAVEAVLGHWDGYTYNQNNFYLFYNDETGKFQFFPYDADNTWGIDWLGQDWAKRSLTAWAPSNQQRPLTKKLLAIPELNEKYIRYIKRFMTLYFTEERIFPLLDQYEEILDDAVKTDTYFDNAFGFTYANFVSSFYSGTLGSHVKYGLREYLQVRTQFANVQIPDLVTANEEEVMNITALYPNPSSESIINVCVPQMRKQPVVYSLSGQQLTTTVTSSATEDCYQIRLQYAAPKGLYVIDVNGVRRKWVYR